MPGTETFASRLQQALRLRRMKQVELCEAAGVPKSAMSQYLSGGFEPKPERLASMAKALGISEAWLRGYDVPMEAAPAKAHSDELNEVLEYYQTKPGMKLLFSLARDATPDDIIRAAEMISELRRGHEGE